MRFSYHPVLGALTICMVLSSTMYGSAVAGPPQAAPDVIEVQTAYGLAAAGYGTRVQGGDVPAESGRTAFSVIACTKLAGLNKTNSFVGADLEGVDVRGVETLQWTTRQPSTPHGVTVSSHSLTTVASVEVASGLSLVEGLQISGVRLRTRAFHDDRGFHTERELTFAEISLAGVPLPLEATPGQVIDVLGVATVTLLSGQRQSTSTGAQVFAEGLRIRLDGTDTIVTVGSTMSQINTRVPAGVLGGYGRAANARLLEDTIVSGKIAVQPLPCHGTNGKWRHNEAAGLDLPGVLEIDGAAGAARGDQVSRTNAYGTTRGTIARVEISDALVITAIQAQANVSKNGTALTRTAEGTSVGSITLGGVPQDIPDAGEVLDISGIAEVTGRTVVRTEFGIKVIALQVKLLSGAHGNTINLGEAFTRLMPG